VKLQERKHEGASFSCLTATGAHPSPARLRGGHDAQLPRLLLLNFLALDRLGHLLLLLDDLDDITVASRTLVAVVLSEDREYWRVARLPEVQEVSGRSNTALRLTRPTLPLPLGSRSLLPAFEGAASNTDSGSSDRHASARRPPVCPTAASERARPRVASGGGVRRTIGDGLDLGELGRAFDELLAEERPPDRRVLLLDGGLLGH
jgi:hypothetical protein